MTYPSLDAYQQVFGMACLVSRAADYKGSQDELQQQLQHELSFYLNNVPSVAVLGQMTSSAADASVTPVLGSWDLVWGPAVFENNQDNIADNAVFVARCEAVAFPGGPVLPAYVVAIAATNPDSLYDWGSEDFAVSQVVDWNTYTPSDVTPSTYNNTDPYISKGTATGVGILLGLTTPATAAAPDTTLQQFLTGLEPDPGTAIIFCGHSLAGALSPTLALYLKEQKALEAFGVTLVYPTAGPTPGDVNFANRFNSAFPSLPSGWQPPAQALPYQSWNTMHWNTYDVVPHAWQKEDLQMVANLYGASPNFKTLALLQGLQLYALRDAAKSGAPYTRIRNSSLPGSLQYSDGSKPLNVPPQSMKDYVTQLFLQHVSLYSGIKADGDIPAVTGLILPQPLPPPALTDIVPGVTKIGTSAMVERISTRIVSGIALHALSDAKPVAEEKA